MLPRIRRETHERLKKARPFVDLRVTRIPPGSPQSFGRDFTVWRVEVTTKGGFPLIDERSAMRKTKDIREWNDLPETPRMIILEDGDLDRALNGALDHARALVLKG